MDGLTSLPTRDVANKMRRQTGFIEIDSGVVRSVQSNTITVDFSASGVDSPNISYLSSYSPNVGDTVWALVFGGDRFVLGKLA